MPSPLVCLVRPAGIYYSPSSRRFFHAWFDGSAACCRHQVGAEELIAKIKSGGSGAINFDRAIGHPALMPQLSAVARILGPRGLMPNPKVRARFVVPIGPS
eukprot:1054199-Prorocentrum_minimum.AAC.1